MMRLLAKKYFSRSSIVNMSGDNYKRKNQSSLKHLFDFSDLNVYDTSVINLSVGAPGKQDLEKCCELFERATKHRMEKELKSGSFLFQYGPALGSNDFRESLATFLTKGYKSEVYSNDIVMTAGATSGNHIALTTLIDLNGYIFVDEVTYMIVLDVFHQYTNIKVIPVKLNENGPDLNSLEEAVQRHKFESKSKMFWGMYYTIPQFHNPTGILFSDEVCKSLVKLARKHDLLVLCDDVYNLLYFDDPNPPKRLFQFDNPNDEEGYKGHVISNGTFSKLLSPGVRVGWMECPPRIVEALRTCGVLLSGGAVSNYSGGIISSLIEMGLAEQHLQTYLEKYKAGRDALCDVLQSLPKECFFKKPKGGYFVWIKFPEHIDCSDFNEYCLKNYKVFGIHGQRFSAEKKAKNYLRLSFSFHSAELLKEAGSRFCLAAQEYLNMRKV